MASHNHLHHQNHHQTTTTTTNCCCCNSCSHNCPPLNYPTVPPSADSLLHTILSYLLQQQRGPQPHFQHPTQNIFHQKHHFHHQNQNFPHQQHQQEHPHAKYVLSSLLSRIDALETSLHNVSLSSSTYNQYSSCSLRDMAARVIQTHFRAFLVRRSRTLRQLKELALIKSSFNSLKLSISKKTHFDFQLVSHKAMDLLLKLDSIQGGDPMIRDGKRSISMDLVKFLEFVDGFFVKRHGISCKAAKNVRLVGNGNKSRFFGSNCGDSSRDYIDIMRKSTDRVKNIHGFSGVYRNEDEDVELEGFHEFIDDEEERKVSRVSKNEVLVNRHVVAQPEVRKSVSFAENGNVYRIFRNSDINESNSSRDGSLTDESVPSDDNGLVVENTCSEVEVTKGLSEGTEDVEEVYLENGGSLQSVDGEKNSKRNLRSEEKSQEGHFVFSAPLPVKMESRADLMKKRKAVKFVV